MANVVWLQASALHIQEEHLLAAQGEYMAFVEGHCHAEDEDHTEVRATLWKTMQFKQSLLILLL